MLTALTLAAVRDQSVDHYLEQEWPTGIMWTGYLQALGFRSVDDPGERVRLLRFYQPSPASGGEVSESEDHCLVHLDRWPQELGISPVWTCKPRPEPPRRWHPLGTGWRAFQKLPKPPETAPKPSVKRSNPIDPKEIRY